MNQLEKEFNQAIGNRCSISDSGSLCFKCKVVVAAVAYTEELESELAAAKEKACPHNGKCGYSQETMDAIVKERDSLKQELAAANAEINRLKVHHEMFIREAALGIERRNAASDAEIERLKEIIRQKEEYGCHIADDTGHVCILEAEKHRLEGTIRSMISACGLPDSAEGCRTAIEWGNEGLKDYIGDANDMIKDGD